jgi:nitrogen-specific signal transduction histidine kinase
MTNAGPNKMEETSESLDLAELLRKCLRYAVILVDERQQVAAINPEAEALLDANASDLLNRPLETLPRSMQQVLRETLATGKAVQDRQIQISVGDRGKVTLCIDTLAARTTSGEVAGVVTTFNDLSAAQCLEQHMRRFDRLASIGTLSASMAHEIKNALVAVKTFVDLLLKENKEAELAGVVSREMRRIDSIVSQMLRFAGPAKPTFATVRIHEILEHALQLVQFQLEGKKIALHRSFGASPNWVRGDNYQLEQAFINLFFNAIEAMGPNGTLTITTEIIPAASPRHNLPEGKKLPLIAVSVKDSGTGVSPENIGRLFEPFFTTKPKGTGLGLSITRRIVQEHGGVITVESELNNGTTFAIAFPLLPRT